MTSVEKPISEREIAARLRAYIAENFLMFAGVDHIGDSDSFLELGIIDSTGILELVGHVEANFGIRVEDDEMSPENLDSLDNLSAYIVRKWAARAAANPADPGTPTRAGEGPGRFDGEIG